MKKMMIYLLAAGIGIFAVDLLPVNANAHDLAHHHKKAWREKGWNENRKAPGYDYNYGYYAFPAAALPVTEDYVPADVVNAMKTTYGSNLYDITSVKCSNGDDCYSVRVFKDGAVQTMMVNASGTPTM